MYERDVLKDLEINESYTAKQIFTFITNNPSVVIISDMNNFMNNNSPEKHIVVEKYEKYIHKPADNSSGVYMIPNSKTRFYRLQKAEN